jgi:uncharacterized protein (TIGR00290 family)
VTDSPKRVLVSWSSGKDSAWMVHVLQRDPTVRLDGLLTTFNQAFDRVSMHAVRRELVEAQADAMALRLYAVSLPWPCANADYERLMSTAIDAARARGVTHVAFGDLFLEDVRQYREARLAGSGLAPLFPLWGRPTAALAQTMVDAGLRARLTCIDPRTLDRTFVGAEFDATLLNRLPADVDPCGERGEFHSFAYDGPMFNGSIALVRGDLVERDGFVYSDFLPASGAADDK